MSKFLEFGFARVNINYIIIHELCHLKIEGHSHNFWNFLHKFVPDYNERIKWLELNSKNILQS
jgi:predicted metal-dependent hydrolase